MRRILMAAWLVGCGGVALPIRNDPRVASSFYCTVSDTAAERNTCTTEAKACADLVKGAATAGAFMSPCVAQTRAWCAIGNFDGKEILVVCGPDRDACGYRREELRGNKYVYDTGECVERIAGER